LSWEPSWPSAWSCRCCSTSGSPRLPGRRPFGISRTPPRAGWSMSASAWTWWAISRSSGRCGSPASSWSWRSSGGGIWSSSSPRSCWWTGSRCARSASNAQRRPGSSRSRIGSPTGSPRARSRRSPSPWRGWRSSWFPLVGLVGGRSASRPSSRWSTREFVWSSSPTIRSMRCTPFSSGSSVPRRRSRCSSRTTSSPSGTPEAGSPHTLTSMASAERPSSPRWRTSSGTQSRRRRPSDSRAQEAPLPCECKSWSSTVTVREALQHKPPSGRPLVPDRANPALWPTRGRGALRVGPAPRGVRGLRAPTA
jgi:hypothetical protein